MAVGFRAREGVVNYYKFFIGKKLLHRCFATYASEKLRGVILDLGSGHGPFRELVQSHKYFSLERDLAFKPSVVASALAVPFKGGIFDGVVCTEVLEHLPEPDACIQEIRRILRIGGLLYLTVPMLWPLHYEPHDYFRFTKYALRYLLGKNGFEVMELEPIGGLFSFVSMRICEKVYTCVNKIPFFLPKEARFLWTIPLVLPVSWLLYLFARLLDPLFRKDVFAWCVLARAVERVGE